MLEASPINVRNWWTTLSTADLPLGISLRNLGVLELLLVKEEIMLSNWISVFDNRRRMGKDEIQILGMKNRLRRHLHSHRNLFEQTKISNILHHPKTFVLSRQ